MPGQAAAPHGLTSSLRTAQHTAMAPSGIDHGCHCCIDDDVVVLIGYYFPMVTPFPTTVMPPGLTV